MANLGLVLLVFGLVCSCLAAKNIGAPNWQLGWLGLAFLIASMVFGGVQKLL